MEIKGILISDIKKEKVTNKQVASFYLMSDNKKYYCVIQDNQFNKIENAKQGDEFMLTGNLKEMKFTKNNVVTQNNIFTVDSLIAAKEIKLNQQLQKSVQNFDLAGIKKSVSAGADIMSLTKEHFSKLSQVQKTEVTNLLMECSKEKSFSQNINSIESKFKL